MANAFFFDRPGDVNTSPTINTDKLTTDPAGPGKGYHVYARSTKGSVKAHVTLEGGTNQANILATSSVKSSSTLTISNKYKQSFMAGSCVGALTDGSYCTMKGNSPYLKADIRNTRGIEVVVPKSYKGYITIMGSARLNHTMGKDVQQVFGSSSKSQYTINGGDWKQTIKVTMPAGAVVGLRYLGS